MGEVIHLRHDIAWRCDNPEQARRADAPSLAVIAELLSMTDRLDQVLRRLRAAAELVACPQGREILIGNFIAIGDVLAETRAGLVAAQVREETTQVYL